MPIGHASGAGNGRTPLSVGAVASPEPPSFGPIVQASRAADGEAHTPVLASKDVSQVKLAALVSRHATNALNCVAHRAALGPSVVEGSLKNDMHISAPMQLSILTLAQIAVPGRERAASRPASVLFVVGAQCESVSNKSPAVVIETRFMGVVFLWRVDP